MFFRKKMLLFKVGSVFCSLPSNAIQHIDYATPITVLPFAHSPIEGLTNFNGQALIQIDIANILGIDQKEQIHYKRLIVNYAQNSYALRVDDVVTLAKIPLTSVTDKNKPPIRALSLKELIAVRQKKKKLAVNIKQIDSIKNPSNQPNIPVLLVASGGRTIAFLAHSIDHFQKIESLKTLREQGSQGDFLIKVKDNLLPTYFLGQLLGQQIENESTAIIFKTEQITWSLCVEQIIKIEYIDKIYSSGTDSRGLWYVTRTGEIRELIDVKNLISLGETDSAPRLWYVTPSGQIQELVDANQLLGITSDSLAITITTPQETSFTSQTTDRLSVDGLRIYCGKSIYLLPLMMATHVDKNWGETAMTGSRFEGKDKSKRSDRIPCIDASALLFGVPSSSIECIVKVNLVQGNETFLGIDRVMLSESMTIAGSWIALDLPYPTTLFFDAVQYDRKTGQWILRFMNTINFSDLPWFIKRSVVKAIIGWFDRD